MTGRWMVVLSAVVCAGLTVSARSAQDAGRASKAGVAPSPTYDEVKGWVDAYKKAHPGNGGKDWDINAKSASDIAADPAAQKLLSMCGPGQRPVIPTIAWEYGGADHPWIKPEAAALVYCVYIPVKKSSPNWQFDASKNHVVADVYVKFPDRNPCKDKKGKEQVSACIGDTTNMEILVDTASLNDGSDAGLKLSESSTVLRLILTDGTKVQLAVD